MEEKVQNQGPQLREIERLHVAAEAALVAAELNVHSLTASETVLQLMFVNYRDV